VNINGALSNVLMVGVVPSALGLLSLDGSGKGQANARNADGTLNSADNPAPQGSTVTVFLTGAGVTNPLESDGVAAPNSNIVPVVVPVALIAGSAFAQGSVHALSGFVPGLFAFDFQVPTKSQLGAQIGIMLESGSSGSQNLFIYIR